MSQAPDNLTKNKNKLTISIMNENPLAPVDMTLTPSPSIGHNITVISKGGKEKTTIKIHLNDECKNGHEDFSITADIYEKDNYGRWRDSGGGCCHEHILSLRPSLALFVALHLSDCTGVPMHAASNAWYWFQGAFPESVDHSSPLGACHGGTGRGAKSPVECLKILKEYIRASDNDVEAIRALNPRSQDEIQYALEKLGFPARWQEEATRAIVELERLSGRKFESKATRLPWKPLSPEQVADIGHKHASGYYSPEAVAQRDKEKREAAKAAKLAAIDAELTKKIKAAEDDAKVARFIVNHAQKGNVIFYAHTRQLNLNWKSYEAFYTPEEVAHFISLVDAHKDELPEGVTVTVDKKPV